MAKFLVLGNLTHDGRNYKKGDTVEMAPEVAAKIPWAVQAPQAAKAAPAAPAKQDGGDKGKK